MFPIRRGAAAMLGAAAIAGASLLAPMPAEADDHTLGVAMGDIASIESLGLLIAMERAEERGVPMDITFFNSEDVAVQAVVGGQADIGVGAPYAFIQNSGAPIRMFYRMSTLLFFPVVNAEVHDGWQSLDGQEVTVHSRGSGTEALMRLMEKVHGIEYSNVSYVPGSEVRAGAMLQGTIDASIVDAAAFKLLREEGGGKFARLPLDGVSATDEALFAGTDTLEARAQDMAVFVEELTRTWAEINADPSVVATLRDRYGLLPDLPGDAAADITAYFTDVVENGAMPSEPASADVARNDLEFLAAAGQVDAPGADFDAGAFWDLSLTGATN